MAPGLATLTYGTFLIMANTLPGWCIPDEAPQINVIPTTEDVEYDFNQDTNRLSQYDVVHSPYGPGVETRIKGLHSGRIEFNNKLKVETKLNGITGEMCMYYKNVEIHFHVDPKIYITNEHLPGTCEHDAIHEHEMKHLMTDRELINEYSLRIGKAVDEDFYRYGYIWGPINPKDQEATFEDMKVSLNNVVRPLIEEMKVERKKRQAAIDTIEEYERVARACER